jgi:very-short-patch-repair endonuclease
MPESVEAWWARRQWSKGTGIPYPVGTYRADWQKYPVLVKQYHPDRNRGITLTQVPPAADVWLLWQCDAGHEFVATPEEQRQRPGRSRRKSTWCPHCSVLATGRAAPRKTKPVASLCSKSTAERMPVGEAFFSECAPRPASAAEDKLRQLIGRRLAYTEGQNAIRVKQAFFAHLEVWPDIVLPELRVAIEYDTIGREGLEHLGKREPIDLRKDRFLRGAGWEVVRIRVGKLQPLGPHDIVASGVTLKLIDRLLDELRAIRGDLIVDCFLR